MNKIFLLLLIFMCVTGCSFNSCEEYTLMTKYEPTTWVTIQNIMIGKTLQPQAISNTGFNVTYEDGSIDRISGSNIPVKKCITYTK